MAQTLYSSQNQGPNCPVEYLRVTKTPNALLVDAKNKADNIPEPTRTFTGSTKFTDFQSFWNLLTQNVSGFTDCSNPLVNDADYNNAINAQSQTAQVPQAINLQLQTNQPQWPPAQPAVQQPLMQQPAVQQPWPAMQQQQWPSVQWQPAGIADNSSSGTCPLANQPPQSPFLSVNWARITNAITAQYIISIIFLFTLIFVFLTYVPKVQVQTITKIIVGVGVCLIYSLVGVIWSLLKTFGSATCSVACGC